MSTVVAALTLRVYLLFLLQAEDGIRDGHVTGVQTCALPISWRPEPNNFVHVRQPLKVVPGQADLPAGYRIEDYFPPKDNYGREQLFEALGLDVAPDGTDRKSTRLNSSHVAISYAVFCLKKKIIHYCSWIISRIKQTMSRLYCCCFIFFCCRRI